jgi:hypothetical protein
LLRDEKSIAGSILCKKGFELAKLSRRGLCDRSDGV